MRNTLLGRLRGMDWLRGLRAATAVSVPMLLGGLLHLPLLAWAALGGFEAIIADPGGPYRHRIQSIAVLTVGGAAGCFIGTLAGQHLDYAIAVTLVWCFAWSYLLVLGAPFASAGTLVQVIYFCGLGAPSPHLSVAWAHAGYLLVGGLWAMLLSLFLWPVDPYRPARFSVGECYLELASFLNSIQELNLRQRSRPALWHRLARHHQGRVRRALEKARESIAGVRTQRASESVRTNNLVVLLESADLVLARTVALAEFLEATSTADVSECVQRAKASLLLISKAEGWIADSLRRRLTDFEEAGRSFQLRLHRVPNDMAQCLAPHDADGHFLLHQMAEITQNLEIAIDSVAAVRTAREIRKAPATAAGAIAPPITPISWREKLRANWNAESLMLRHAIRITAVCGLEVWILYHFHISHGYWLPLTSLIVLQPHLSGTFRRSLQRMGGTIGGGILAAVLAVFLHSQISMAAAIFPMALLTLAVYPVSYTWFCFFLTPTFVLVSLPYFGDWQLAALRIGNTILGAVLALLAMSFLWPAWERDRFGLQLQRSLEANRRYLDALIASWQSPANRTTTRTLAEARRAIGLAHNDSEDSLDRLVLEPSLPGTAARRAAAEAVEPAIAFVAYLRRFGQSITTLAAWPLDDAWKRSAPVQQQLAAMRLELDQLIHALAGHAEVRRPGLGAAPAFDPAHPGQRQLRRMERQLTILARNLEAMQRAHLFPSTSVSLAQKTIRLR